MEVLIYFIFYNVLPLCLYYLFFCVFVLMAILCLLVLQYEDQIYSVLTLILIFMLTAFTLLLLNVEFLAYVYIIVYVGAVVLLFIFVTFMVGPVYIQGSRHESLSFFYFFIAKFLILFSIAVWKFIFFLGYYKYSATEAYLSKTVYTNDIILFSTLLYTDHFFLLWVVAVVLLVAMIAPIIFHFNYKNGE